jgi:hypothetical protein
VIRSGSKEASCSVVRYLPGPEERWNQTSRQFLVHGDRCPVLALVKALAVEQSAVPPLNSLSAGAETLALIETWGLDESKDFTPGLNHFWIRRRLRRSTAMLDERHHRRLVEVIE